MASQFDNRNDFLTRYNYERERRRRATAQAQPIPQMMSAHEPVVNPNANINPFQDNFTPNTNTVSMGQIAAQVAPQPQQPFFERVARGAASLPIGIAALTEGMTTDPLQTAQGMGESIAKHAAETMAISTDVPANPMYPLRLGLKAADKLNVPILGSIEPKLQELQDERKQAYVTNPILAPLDIAGLVGAGQGASALSSFVRNRAASRVPEIIRKAVEPEVVPEVAQKPVISEPQQVPEIIRQAVEPSTPPVEKVQAPQTISEGVGQGKSSDGWVMRPVEYRGGVASVFETPMGLIERVKSKSKAAGLGGDRWRATFENTEYLAKTPDEASQWLKQQRAGKISPEPTATPDAAVRPAQPTAPTAKAKEPWEMTQAETVAEKLDINGFNKVGDRYTRVNNADGRVGDATGWANSLKKEFAGGHKMVVEDALEAGKPVPPEVLADYPDLAAKYGKQGGGSVELGAFGTPSVLHSTMGAVGRVAEKSVIPIQYIAKKIDGFMEKRGLANPLGTPEIVLKDAGIVEAFRDATAKEHAFVAEQSAKLKEILGGRIKSEKYLAQMFRHLDNPEAILNPTEKALRGWFDEMLNTVNEFRVKRGEEPINYTEGYIPHIFKKSKELLDADQSIALPRKAQNRFANVRTGAEGYEKDLIQALELYTKATARDMYVNDALHASIPAIEAMSKNGSKILRREVITTPDGASKTINFYNLNNADMWSKRGYAEAFVRAQLGLPTQGQRFFKQLGINPRTSQRVSNMATGLVYRNLLGMAIDTGIKNLSQVTHTIAENGMAPTMRGIGKFLTPEGIKTARSEHLLKEFDSFLLAEDMPAATRAKIFKQFDENVINGAMRFSEFVNRGIAYHTALDDAIKAGKSIAEAHEIALKAVRGTQFEYNKLGTSPFMRGPLTRPAAQFMTFPVKTSEMLYRWANEGNTGRGKLLRYFATVGGLVYAGKEVGVELGNIFFDPTKTVDKDSKGGIELPLSGNKVKLDPLRLGTTGFAPQGAVPAVTKPYKYINDLITKDRTAGQRVGQAAREFLPGGRFIGKAVDVATGSEYRDERGRLIRKDSKADAFLKLFGGRSSNQESMNNKKSEVRDIEQEYYETRRKIIDTQLNGDVEGAKRMIADFSEKYPYLGSRLRKSLRQGRKDELRKRQMTSDERFYDNKIRQRIEQNL